MAGEPEKEVAPTRRFRETSTTKRETRMSKKAKGKKVQVVTSDLKFDHPIDLTITIEAPGMRVVVDPHTVH